MWPQRNHFTYLHITWIIFKNQGCMTSSPKQQSLRQELVNFSRKHPESRNILGFAGQMVSVATVQLGLVVSLAGTAQASVAAIQENFIYKSWQQADPA